MNRAYVVTGAAGHLGVTIVKDLERKNCKIYAFVLYNDDLSILEKTSATIFKGDIRDTASLENMFSSILEEEIYVIHAAGIVSISSKVDKLLYDVNVNGTKNMIDLCKKYNVKRFIYVSSVHAIEEKPKGHTISEVCDFSPLKVVGAYAKTKAEATKYVLDSLKDGLDVVIVHPSGIIGPNDFNRSHTNQMIKDFLNRKLFAYIDGGYDFVDVRDVSYGIISACDNGIRGECYILSGSYISVKNLLLNLHTISKVGKVKFKIPMWLIKIIVPFLEIYYKILKQPPLFTSYSLYTLKSNAMFSHEKATKQLQYFPRNLNDTLKDTIKWLIDNNLVKLKTINMNH